MWLSVSAHRGGLGQRQTAEACRGGRICRACPALWVLNLEIPWFSTLFTPQLLSALPPASVPFTSPLDNTPSCAEALEAPIKASDQRPAPARCVLVLSAHLKILLLQAWATKRGAALSPLAP